MVKSILLCLLLSVLLAAGILAVGHGLYTAGTYIELYIELNDGVGNKSIVHDERILLRAEKSIDAFKHYRVMYFEDSRFSVRMQEDKKTFNITENDETYMVINRISMIKNRGFSSSLSEEQKKQMSEWEDIANYPKYQRALDESKALLYDYIRKSSVLRDKEQLIAELENIPVKVGQLDTAGISIYAEEARVICINKNDVRTVVIVHELVHMLQGILWNGLDSQNPMFVEIMTDIITNAVYPSNNVFHMSAYREHNDNVLAYIGIFKEKAIEAFFYGYDVLYDEITQDEWYLFMYAIEAAVRSPYSTHYSNCYHHLISKWLGMKG